MKEYRYRINGNEYAVTINSINGNKADVTVNGTSYEVEMENQAPVAAPVSAAPSVAAPVQSPAPQPAPQAAPQAVPAATVPAGGKKITSPLPGVIIEISVKEGDQVKAGQQVAVLEAMKMENAIEAEFSGTVKAIHVQKGESVLEGAPIVTIA